MSDAAAEARLDAALIARVLAQDDRAAFAHLVRRHQGMVRAQLRRLCGSDDGRADDLAQETFLLAWRKLNQFRFEARFSTWLYQLAYSCFLQAVRAQRDEIALTPEHEVENDEGVQVDQNLSLDINKAIDQLPEAERSVLVHCYHLDLSHEEAAFVLKMPIGTLKSHINRGKAKLKQMLSAWSEHAN
ncbi:MAG: sigma-70 family RNA polymerase sigma factor [Undibacterium sp.]|nr:sigma-70 family RNA polymerase sigma factor [Undibacterium sp.]